MFTNSKNPSDNHGLVLSLQCLVDQFASRHDTPISNNSLHILLIIHLGHFFFFAINTFQKQFLYTYLHFNFVLHIT
jgi:hypothetical protein